VKLNGREVNFKRTIWATIAASAMCPDKDITRLDEVLRSNYMDGNMAAAQFICILSEAYEKAKAYEVSQIGETYEQNPVTMDELMNLEDFDLFQQLFIDAADAWKKDARQTVETEPVKGKKKSKAARSDSVKPGTSTSDTGQE